ncbi:importin-13 isoform X1 [Amyelois transitella]|uniref:importin-13 isoform X1 n=1 Tax=Amyelois transitella TaxID=680683 RepID=UPI0029903BAB|nr:importin-13 isoform X1 [Amyelois transitella]
MDYSAQNLEYAVAVFYNGEQAERAKAHAWLTSAQRAPEAWKFVWELLQPTKSEYLFQGTEVQFYAATTLHTKILRCWSELPQESYDELKEKILQSIFTYSNGPKIVTNRLCISLAAFILQQGTVDLATILRPLSSAENTALLLEVLTVIPEEYNSMTMGSALRAKNRTALQQACPMVLDDMLRYLQTAYQDFGSDGPPEEAVQAWLSAATCAGNWLTLGGEDSPESGGGALPDLLPLCRALLMVVKVLYMSNEAVSDSALDACEASLSAVRAAAASQQADRHPAAALQLLAELVALGCPLVTRDNVANSINEELLSAFITCCVALGECHAQSIVMAAESAEGGKAPDNVRQGAEAARQLIEILLAAQGAPGHYPIHETRSNLVFGFWYTLQDQVLYTAKSEKPHPMWRQVFSRLLTTLVSKSEMLGDSMSWDDQELLRCYRQDIADTVMYCYGILGEDCWSVVECDWSAAQSDSRREAALHAVLALADAQSTRPPPALLSLLRAAVHVARTAPASPMLATALDCLGGYGALLSSLGGGSLAAECVSAAGAALARSPAAAAHALRKLCADCSGPAAALAEDIVHCARSSASRSGDAWTRRQLAAAAGSALVAAALPAAARLLQPLAVQLRDELALQAQNPMQAANGAAECAGALLSALAESPALAALLLRTLHPALPAFAAQPQLAEPLFHIVKQALSSLMGDCLPFAPELAQLTVIALNANVCAAGLDSVKLMVIMVGSEWAGCPELLRAACALAAARVAPDVGAAPDVADALFALLLTVTRKKPHFVDCVAELLPDLVDLGCNCVRTWEAQAARAACSWLAALAAQSPAALQPRADQLTAAALRCIGGLTPRSQMEPLTELLLALNCAAWRGAGLAGWLRAALAQPGFPTHHATDEHKHKFIASVLKEKSSKRRLLASVQEFSLACRGLIGTEYARQTMASRQLVA